jgi:hypothetical protein
MKRKDTPMQNENLLQEAGRIYGKAIYDALSETDKAVVAFGMTPLHVKEEAEEYFKTEIAKSYARIRLGDESLHHMVSGHIYKADVQKALKGVILGLKSAAKENGKMIA